LKKARCFVKQNLGYYTKLTYTSPHKILILKGRDGNKGPIFLSFGFALFTLTRNKETRLHFYLR